GRLNRWSAWAPAGNRSGRRGCFCTGEAPLPLPSLPTRVRDARWGRLFYPLPPCGGGIGWGVDRASHLGRFPPTPSLPPGGGGGGRERPPGAPPPPPPPPPPAGSPTPAASTMPAPPARRCWPGPRTRTPTACSA